MDHKDGLKRRGITSLKIVSINYVSSAIVNATNLFIFLMIDRLLNDSFN